MKIGLIDFDGKIPIARWVNGRIYKKCDWQDYEPWVKAKKELTFNY